MGPVEKSVSVLVASIKDCVSKNVVPTCKSIGMEETKIRTLLTVINSSIDEGMSRSFDSIRSILGTLPQKPAAKK